MVKLIFCFAVICCSIPSLNAQEIGIFTGPSFHKFYTPAKEHMGVSEKFEAASGIVLGLSFKLKSDTSLFYSLLVDSKKQTGYAEVFYESGHASSYSYLEFALHNISLSYLLNLDLFKIKKVLKSRLCAGPSLTCIAAAKSDGHGYNNIFTNQVDTSGVSHTSIQGVYWSVTDNRSGYFRQFGFGLTGN